MDFRNDVVSRKAEGLSGTQRWSGSFAFDLGPGSPPTPRPGNPYTRLGMRKTWTQSVKELLRRLGREPFLQVFRLQARVALRRVAVAAAAPGAHDQ